MCLLPIHRLDSNSSPHTHRNRPSLLVLASADSKPSETIQGDCTSAWALTTLCLSSPCVPPGIPMTAPYNLMTRIRVVHRRIGHIFTTTSTSMSSSSPASSMGNGFAKCPPYLHFYLETMKASATTCSIHPSFQDAVRSLYKGVILFAQSTVLIVQIESAHH